MFTRPIIWPYALFSGSARNLARALRTKRVRPNGRYRPRRRDLVINWGASTVPVWFSGRVGAQTLNLPQYVRTASDKLAAFRALERAGCAAVPFTTDIEVARSWLAQPVYGRKLNAVVCRQLTRANSGRGIVLAKTPEEVVPAPLYTRYQPKAEEYRVHVWQGRVIDIQEKRRRNGFAEYENASPYIRNHPNGWVFCRDGVQPPDEVVEKSLEAVAALGLHFGAVDLGYHPDYGTGLYEINTAPGIEGQTLVTYADSIRRELHA